MRLIISTSLKQVNLVWSTVSVLKADPPASYPGKHADFLVSTDLQSPYTLLIGGVPSREDSFYRCTLYGSRIASPPHTFTSPQPVAPHFCRSEFPGITFSPSPLLTGNSSVSTVISAQNFKRRFFLNHTLSEARLLSSFKDKTGNI